MAANSRPPPPVLPGPESLFMPTDPATPDQGSAPRAAPPPLHRPSRRALVTAAAVAGGLAGLIVVTGLVSRAHDSALTKHWTDDQAVPVVSLVSPTSQSGAQALVLPGNLQAFYNAPIYARVSGYLHAWNRDIGARVKTGELLATIDTPELDQQLIHARADLASAEADMQLASTTAQRWERLLAQDAVSKQETDEKTGDLAVKTAHVNSAKAEVNRLLALKAFSRIVAPFDGVVTARKTDIGALINAGAGASTSSELFDVAKINQLRLYVSVPQSDTARLRPGVTATLTVPEYPGRVFPATLTTTAKAVSDRSGTLLVELLVNNADEQLQAGDYATVKFDIPPVGAGGTLEVPSSALLFRKTGMEAALVGPDGRIHLRHVTIARDLGTSVEVSSGLSASDRIVDNPPDSLAEGQSVRVSRPPTTRRPGGAVASD
jgi:RND family efflux transporter MFP subunit